MTSIAFSSSFVLMQIVSLFRDLIVEVSASCSIPGESESYMRKASTISGSVKLMYGGSQGKGKRLDIHLESSVYKFMFNLRNKQSGLYPSHIMCDYKKK